jgi:hypothetical protein
MEQTAFSEADSRSAGKKFLALFLNPRVYYCIQSSPPVNTIFSQRIKFTLSQPISL